MKRFFFALIFTFAALATSVSAQTEHRLNANPLADISATENRSGVMLKGKWHTQQELNGWLDQSAQAISTSFKGH